MKKFGKKFGLKIMKKPTLVHLQKCGLKHIQRTMMQITQKLGKVHINNHIKVALLVQEHTLQMYHS